MALIRSISKSITSVSNLEGQYQSSSISINANIGDYVCIVSCITGTYTPPVVTGATLIADQNTAGGTNERYVFLYKATSTTVSAIISSSDRVAMFTMS